MYRESTVEVSSDSNYDSLVPRPVSNSLEGVPNIGNDLEGRGDGSWNRRSLLTVGVLVPLLAACYRDEHDYPDEPLSPEVVSSQQQATEGALKQEDRERANLIADQNRNSYRQLHRLILVDAIGDKPSEEGFISVIAGQLASSRHDSLRQDTDGGWLWSTPDRQLSMEFRSGGNAYDDMLTITKIARYGTKNSGARHRVEAVVGLVVTDRALRGVDTPTEAIRAISASRGDMLVERVMTSNLPLRKDGTYDRSRLSDVEKGIRVFYESSAGKLVTDGAGMPIVSEFMVSGAPSIENQAGHVLPDIKRRLGLLAS